MPVSTKIAGGTRPRSKIKPKAVGNIISIITVSYNAGAALEKTIKSIISQPSNSWDYIVIDGGSTDNTLDVLERYSPFITHWISESDAGIYDAMNKGLDYAAANSGVLFLNAGDIIVDNLIDENLVAPCLLPVKCKSRFSATLRCLVPRKSLKLGMPYCHQGVIFLKSDLRYNTNFRIASDYDFFLNDTKALKTDVIQAPGYILFDTEGISSLRHIERDKENRQIIRSHFGPFWALRFAIYAKSKAILKNILLNPSFIWFARFFTEEN